MATRIPVIAAIPNYNMSAYLRRLLPQVLAQDYDRVLVLDDDSTDDSAEAVASFGAEVTLVRAPRNAGAGANRNQVIDHVEPGALIHFIDADMDLVGSETAAVARELAEKYRERGVGVIGGLVSRVDGWQEPFNYGPVFSLRANLTGGFPPLIDRLRHRPRLVRAAARLCHPGMQNWPRIVEPPAACETYWVHEGNMVVYSDVFRAVGGYDPHIREHEAQDFAIRLEKRGVKRYFDPSIEVVHHHVDVRGKFRFNQQGKSALYLLRKHGFRRYLTDH